MKLRLELDLGDGPIELLAGTYALVAWERRHQGRVFDISDGLGLEDLCYLAYEACKQAKVVVPATFDDFIKRVESVQPRGWVMPTPTRPAASDDATPSSSS